MKKVFIITWQDKSRLGFDFDVDLIFNTKEEADKQLILDNCDYNKYSIKEVDEVFIYLFMYLDDSKITIFTDNKEDLEKVYDFFENVKDQILIKKYLKEALSVQFYTFDRIKFIDREISYLEQFKK